MADHRLISWTIHGQWPVWTLCPHWYALFAAKTAHWFSLARGAG